MKTEFADCESPIIRLPVFGERNARLMVDWRIGEVCGRRFIVPAGTRTDGASIPRFLWRVCGHPLQAPRVYAAVLHDWLYTRAAPPDARRIDGLSYPADLTRAQSDECYYRMLRHFGVAAWRAGMEYCALRLFGAKHYKEQK